MEETRQPAAGGLDGLEEINAPRPVDPSRVWTSPAGRRIADGTVDKHGYVLPLDMGRPKVRRPEGERPSAARIEVLRSLAGASPFPETRLGPDDGHTQNETSVDAAGSTVVAGWNAFTDSGLVMGVARSANAGQSWTFGVLDGHDVMSDPVVVAAGSGRWYYAYLGNGAGTGSDTEIFVRRSLDDGVTWQAPVAVTNDSNFDDKPEMAGRGDEVLVAWADFGVSPAHVRAARSLDGGLTFGNDTDLVDLSGGGNGACAVIAPDGTYYVFWRDSFQDFLWFSKSTDQGDTWSQDASIVPMNPLPSTMTPGPYRIVNLPTAAAHPVSGDLLVLWNDQAMGDPDVLAVRSTDGGATWSAPVKVNDDAGTDAQFFPWVVFDEAGTAHAVWYDQRQNGSDLDVYTASSTDGGATWSPNVRVTAAAFTPVLPWEGGAAAFIGDYNGIAAAGGRVYPFYQDSREGNQDVWISVIGRPEIFADGFESGDGSGWDGVVP